MFAEGVLCTVADKSNPREEHNSSFGTMSNGRKHFQIGVNLHGVLGTTTVGVFCVFVMTPAAFIKNNKKTIHFMILWFCLLTGILSVCFLWKPRQWQHKKKRLCGKICGHCFPKNPKNQFKIARNCGTQVFCLIIISVPFFKTREWWLLCRSTGGDWGNKQNKSINAFMLKLTNGRTGN